MLTIKDILNDPEFSEDLKNQLKDRDHSHIISELHHTDGKITYITHQPTEIQIRQARLEELCDKMDNGNVDLTEEENKEVDEIFRFLGVKEVLTKGVPVLGLANES